jgi:DNA primase
LNLNGISKKLLSRQSVAQPFVDSHPSALTLQIKKEHRKGKFSSIFIAIAVTNDCFHVQCPGLPGAPVSTPLQWEELDSIESPKN